MVANIIWVKLSGTYYNDEWWAELYKLSDYPSWWKKAIDPKKDFIKCVSGPIISFRTYCFITIIEEKLWLTSQILIMLSHFSHIWLFVTLWIAGPPCPSWRRFCVRLRKRWNSLFWGEVSYKYQLGLTGLLYRLKFVFPC